LILIREAGKLPLPTISAVKSQSHISALICSNVKLKRIKIERSAVPKSGLVVVVDDILAIGKTLCAVLQTLDEVGVAAENIGVIVVAKFLIYCGQELLYKRRFSKVHV
jgi:adenine/guanine phosphoribosyltransferase-like PRPP-binding protein